MNTIISSGKNFESGVNIATQHLPINSETLCKFFSEI